MMNQELQWLIKNLYGDRQLTDQQLSNFTKQWESNHMGFRDNMKNAVLNKIKQDTKAEQTEAGKQAAMSKANFQTPNLGQDSYEFNKSQGRAANDMSAIADFKQAFRQARQGGHKTFFWKKTKANPSGMFSTEMASSQIASPENIPVENSQIPVTSIKADMSKTDLPIFKGPRISQGLANALSPKAPETGTNSYQFDKTQAMVESTKAGLARQFRTNNIPRPMGNPGQNIMGEQYNKNYPYSFKEGGVAPSIGNGSFVDTIIEALNNNTDIQTINNLIQQSGQNPETVIKEIVSRAQGGDQAAAMAFSNLEKLMKNSTVAKLGTKLNYIQRLKGICPEGTEKIYLKNGGCMCAQKAQKGSNGIEKNDTIHHNKQVYDLTGKHKQFKKLTNKDYRNLPTKKQASVDNKDMMRAKDAEKKSCGGKTKKKK